MLAQYSLWLGEWLCCCQKLAPEYTCTLTTSPCLLAVDGVVGVLRKSKSVVAYVGKAAQALVLLHSTSSASGDEAPQAVR